MRFCSKHSKKEYKALIQDSLLKKGFHNQSNSLDNNVPSNQNNNNSFPFKENKNISFFKSAKDKDTYYQGLANYVKTLVDFIYSEMIRSLREYIPKATGNNFIKSLRNNMNFYLLQYISKNPEICQDLEEDQDVAQKRVYYIDAQKKLKKINKTIGLDDQIGKFFKEDNIKNIETILQNQGINEQNAVEKEEKEKEKEKEKSKKAKSSVLSEIGVPPKKEPASEKLSNNPSKTNISQSTKNNLFGNAPKPNATKTNLFGNPNPNQSKETNPAQKKNPLSNTNLFGNPTQNTKKPVNTQTKNNLFGTPQSNNAKGSNLFGSNTNSTTNLNKPQGTPKTNQQNQKGNSNLSVSLKIDPKEGNISGVNVKGNIDPKDAYNFYQKNKQNLPPPQTMISGAQKLMGQSNNNTTGKKVNVSALANLFGSTKK